MAEKSPMLYEKVMSYLKQIQPDALIVLGDTYSGLSVLPASHHGIKIFHMEAGLRAWDKRMPEQKKSYFDRSYIGYLASV